MTDKVPDQNQLLEFGDAIYNRILEAPFGSLPKSELEIILFEAHIRAKMIDIESLSNFELACRLQCSPSKASNLVFNYRLRNVPRKPADMQEKLANVTKVVTNRKNSKDGEVTLNVDDRFWRGELVNQLKKANVFADTSFNPERITLDEKHFLKACPDLFGDAGREISDAVKKANRDKGQFFKDLMGNLATGAATNLGGVAVDQISGGISISAIAKTIMEKIIT